MFKKRSTLFCYLQFFNLLSLCMTMKKYFLNEFLVWVIGSVMNANLAAKVQTVLLVSVKKFGLCTSRWLIVDLGGWGLGLLPWANYVGLFVSVAKLLSIKPDQIIHQTICHQAPSTNQAASRGKKSYFHLMYNTKRNSPLLCQLFKIFLMTLNWNYK